jgi:hypothetical protein
MRDFHRFLVEKTVDFKSTLARNMPSECNFPLDPYI